VAFFVEFDFQHAIEKYRVPYPRFGQIFFDMKLLVFLFSILTSLSSCTNDKTTNSEDHQGQEISKTAYTNGRIYTVDTVQPWAETIIVEGNKIIFIGTDSDAQSFFDDQTAVIDLKGALVLPGIHDVHLHPLEASSNNFKFILDDTETDAEGYVDEIATAINANANTDWLLGWGYSLHTILDAERTPIEILDEISTEVGIAIMEQTSHSLWVNSKALELARISASSPNPSGGIIMKDENGAPDGILIDNAGNILLDLILAPTDETLENDYNGLVNVGLPELAKNGITSISDARTYWKRDHQKVWQRIEDEGKLTVRANLGLWAYPTEDDASQIAAIKALYSNNTDSFLKINQIKVYNDGIIHNTTSAMLDEYKIDLFDLPTNNGLNYFSESRLADYIAQLESFGFDFHIHAIGNRGIKEALNAIEQSGSVNGRHRITHVEFVDPADYPRFAQLNVTADMQVAGEFTQPEFWSDNNEYIDAEHTQNVVPLKSLTDADARITLSSDWDVSSLNPFVGLQNAVTRAPQSITVAQAVKAYTLNAAYVMRQENLVGSLEVGKLADFIVLNQDIFAISPSLIGQTEVEMTILDGEIVFQK